MNSASFFTLIIGIISGMIAGIFVEPSSVGSWWWAIGGGGIVWILLLKRLVVVQRVFFVFCLGICAVILGLYRTHQFHKIYPFDAFDRYHGATITVVGDIYKPTTVQPGKQQVRIKPISINGVPTVQKTRDIMIHTSDLESFRIGDRLVVSGKFFVRENFQSDTGRTVQYRLMSYSKKIAGDIRYPNIQQVVSYQQKIIPNTFVTIKQKFVQTLHRLFVAPGAGLLSGIIIGDISAMQNNLVDIFRLVGLVHIVVLSGYNITLVANFFVRIFAPFGYFRRLIIAMIALCFFIAIVGISQTSLRAGIMALCAFSARYFIRPYMITRGIMLALVIMTWISPYAVLFDLSLQLSFLATIGIVYLFPIAQDHFTRLSENMFGEILLQTFSVNVMTLPLILYQMGYFSPVSFPVNIIVLGIVPWVTVAGFFAVFIGMIIVPLGQIIAFPIQLIMDTIITFSTWVAEHDPFGFVLQPFSVWILIGIYFFVFLIYCIFINKNTT